MVRNDGGTSGFTRSDRRLSPRAAIAFRPAPGQLYSLAYGASFNPAIDYLSLAPTDSSLPPETDRSIEVGATWPLVHEQLKLSTAWFDEQLRNARLADPGDPAVQLAAYDQAVRGVEIALAGQLADHWNITAAFTHLDARLTATADPLARNRAVPNTPRDAVNLWSAVAPAASWTFAAGVRFIGQRFADFDNTARVPATLVANLMGAYRANRHLSFQLNVDNVANRHTFTSLYYAAPDENHAVPGPGRTLILTARLAY
jgi:catecholate siderophore receptor